MSRLTEAAQAPAAIVRLLADTWARLRAWRRIRFTWGGIVFTLGAAAVGFAAVNTGNNLLYLLLGAMLGIISVSSWFSEKMIRDLDITRRVPRGVTVGNNVRLVYSVRSLRKRIPTLAVEISETGLAEKAFLPRLPAGDAAETRSLNQFIRRGIYPLRTVTLSTSFPFGLFLKERDLSLPGELVIWPRSDRPVRPPALAQGRRRAGSAGAVGAPGTRGEYRGLREYRVGDDPRDIHWKSSARSRAPMVREYDADTSEDLWICLDSGGEPDEQAEALVEVAASLAAQAAGAGRRFGLVTSQHRIQPAAGPGQLESVLDALARVDFHPAAAAPSPQVGPSRCVLVSLSGRGSGSYADTFVGAN